MKLDFRAFAFVITLAAVVNGLRIVRWLTAVAKYHDYFSKKSYTTKKHLSYCAWSVQTSIIYRAVKFFGLGTSILALKLLPIKK